MQHLLNLADAELKQWFVDHGLPGYRAGQVRKWIYEKRAISFDEMTDLPRDLRERLKAEFAILTASIVTHKTADDGTEKLLLQWPDGQRIECVLIRENTRRTICISTQVGCAMGCVFCASGLDGVARNLTTGEIIEQMLHLQKLLPADDRLSNIVVMGMGEPLANLDNLIPALERSGADGGLGIGGRHVTISTVGLPAAMDRLTEMHTNYSLAVSLHAPNDDLRTQIVPVNKNISIEAVVAAADRFFADNGRRLTFEYVLLGELNDRAEHAHQLVDLLRGRTAILNVIPYNPVAGLPYRTPSGKALERFLEILRDGGINVQVRLRKGDQIDAACGQLRRSFPQTPAVVALDAPRV